MPSSSLQSERKNSNDANQQQGERPNSKDPTFHSCPCTKWNTDLDSTIITWIIKSAEEHEKVRLKPMDVIDNSQSFFAGSVDVIEIYTIYGLVPDKAYRSFPVGSTKGYFCFVRTRPLLIRLDFHPPLIHASSIFSPTIQSHRSLRSNWSTVFCHESTLPPTILP